MTSRCSTNSTAVRFAAKVRVGEAPADRPGLGRCLVWTAGCTAQGYGGFHPSHNVTVLAHRWAYEQVHGPIPADLVIDHLCRNRRCVNVAHLDAVSNEENLRRGAGFALQNGLRRGCIHGHPYTPENTYIDPRGGIRCRECARIRDRQPHRNATLRRRKRVTR